MRIKKTLLTLGVLASARAHAYAVNEVANHTFKCGSITVAFGPKGETATIRGESLRVEWGNRAIDAVIGSYDFTVNGTNDYELEGEKCRLVR